MKNVNYFLAIVALTSCICYQNALGQTWTDRHLTPAASLSYDGSKVYKQVQNPATTGGVFLYISNDDGGTWTDGNAGLSGLPGTTSSIGPVFPTSTGRLITSRNTSSGLKIIYSDNQGSSWSETTKSLNYHIGSISETNGVIYLKQNPGTAIYSSDNGLTWNTVSGSYATSSTVGADNGEIYVVKNDSLVSLNSNNFSFISGFPLSQTSGTVKSYSQNFFQIKSSKLYYSSNKQNWTEITPAPPSIVEPITVTDVFAKSGIFYVASNRGLYVSANGGSNYTRYQELDPITNDLDLVIKATNNVIVGDRAGAYKASTYRMDLSGTSAVAENEFYNSLKVYPNPSNYVVAISEIPSSSTLSIIDATGKLVYSTVTKNEQTITINTTNYISGIYLIRINNNGSVANRKLVINR